MDNNTHKTKWGNRWGWYDQDYGHGWVEIDSERLITVWDSKGNNLGCSHYDLTPYTYEDLKRMEDDYERVRIG